jgi:hypothetical protein
VLEQLRLFGCDLTALEELIDQGLIVRDLRQPTLTPEVSPAVTDLSDDDMRVQQHQAGQRRAHAVFADVGTRSVVDLLVCALAGQAHLAGHAV